MLANLITETRNFGTLIKRQLCRQRSPKIFLFLALIIIYSALITGCGNDKIAGSINKLQGNLIIWHSLEPEVAELINNIPLSSI